MGDRTHAQPLERAGILLLLGIVKKNSILQVDYANTLRAQGLALHQAIVEASRTRLRPILMTTSAIIAGLIPTALGVGIGGEQRSAIALTIIGGQSLCLFLTLLLVPVAYVQLDRFETLIVSDGARAWLGRLSAITLRRLKPAAGRPVSVKPRAIDRISLHGDGSVGAVSAPFDPASGRLIGETKWRVTTDGASSIVSWRTDGGELSYKERSE